MNIKDGISGVANGKCVAARVCGGGARTVTACLREALPAPKRNGDAQVTCNKANRRLKKVVVFLVGVLMVASLSDARGTRVTSPTAEKNNYFDHRHSLDTIFVTAYELRNITDIDDSFVKLDIDWFTKNATSRIPIAGSTSFQYSYTESNEKTRIRIAGRDTHGYIVRKYFNNSHFVIQMFFDTNGNIREKGWHFNQTSTSQFKKGIWYYFDELGMLIETIDHDLPFKFTFDDLLLFCRNEGIILPKGYSNDPQRPRIRRELQCPDYNLPVWYIIHNIGRIRETIVIDGISGKVLSRNTTRGLPR